MAQTEGCVWLIGADGFTGHYLRPTLEAEGYRVDVTPVDITNGAAVQSAMLDIQPQYIINLAAISFVPDGADATIYGVNCLGAENILSACLQLEQPPRRIILASSANIYGAQQQEVIDENCLPNPINHYGCSKWSMEQIARTYADRLNITVTRPFNYTGRGQKEKFLVPKIVAHFQKKASSIELGNVDIWRDFSDVRWISRVYSQLLPAPGPELNIFNLCSGQLISIREIIATLENLSGHKIEIKVNPDFVRQADIVRQRGDNGRLVQRFEQLSAPPAFEETLAWMLEA
ncbi:MAG: GDP-mannose 4,6-dehydratase [Porticoccaceae bacterium]|nr:GDP-mannose 4,6-dehydratase [Porticoccaceae bacterium]